MLFLKTIPVQFYNICRCGQVGFVCWWCIITILSSNIYFFIYKRNLRYRVGWVSIASEKCRVAEQNCSSTDTHCSNGMSLERFLFKRSIFRNCFNDATRNWTLYTKDENSHINVSPRTFVASCTFHSTYN